MSFGEVFRTQTKRGPRVLTLSHFKTIEISFQCVSGWWWLEPWNGLWLSRNSWEWNVIPTDDSSIIFQRGWRSTTNWSTSWSWWRWSQWDHSDPWTLLTNRIGRLILKKMLLNIYWPGNKFYFLLFFCRVSKIGNGFSDVFFCIFQKFQIWCLAAGEVHFDAIVAAVSRLFGLGPRWEDVGRWLGRSSGHQRCTNKLWGKIRKFWIEQMSHLESLELFQGFHVAHSWLSIN